MSGLSQVDVREKALSSRSGPTSDPFHLIRPETHWTASVTRSWVGRRLDQFLKAKIPWRSRNQIQALVASGKIAVNGSAAKSSYRLKSGEEITFELPPPPEEVGRIKDIPLEIIHEDDDIVVLNKQANIVVHPAGRRRFDTLINALHYRYRSEDPSEDVVPKLGHRLDKETSGVLVVCKSHAARTRVSMDFEDGRVRKEYLTLVEGVVERDEGEICLPLDGDRLGPNPMKMVVNHETGSPSLTQFAVLERFRDFSFVSVRPKTGRQHQIRVHFAAIGHPVVCDKAYGIRKALRVADLVPQSEEGQVLLERQALHAAKLTLRHPAHRGEVTFEAPLPEDMEAVLGVLRTPLTNDQ